MGMRFSIDEMYTPADGFHGTCCLIRRAYQGTLADLDLQIYLVGFPCQQGLCVYVFYI